MLRRAFKISILVGIFIIGSVSAAFAESGETYDLIEIGVDEYQWTSHYPRIWDGSQWVNHIANETPDIFEIRTANISFDFDKNTCTFTLNNPETNLVEIPDYASILLIDGAPAPSPSCTFTNLVYDKDTISFTAQRNQFDTHYVIHSNGFVEWTYTSGVNTGASKAFSIEELCDDCPIVTPDSETVDFGAYTYDSKNDVHGALTSLEFIKCTPREGLECSHNNPRFKVKYEQTIPNGERLDIDPTLSYTGTTFDRTYLDSVPVNNACDLDGSVTPVASKYRVYIYALIGADDCYRTVQEWDITSIPDKSIINDVSYKYEIASVTNAQNCDYNSIESQPSLATDDNVFTDIGDGTTFVNNDATCTTTGIKTLDLGDSANTDLQDNLSSNWWAIGIKLDDETLDGSDHFINGVGSDLVGGTQAPELQVVYTLPGPPELEVSSIINNIGDVFQINGTINVTGGNPLTANITSIVVRENGTTIDTNSTFHNQTLPYSISYGPIWELIDVGGIRNITVTVTAQNSNNTSANETKTYQAREYAPDYFTAQVPSQGDVNYTKPSDAGIKVNRDKGGATFQIECACLDYADAFLNSTDTDTWFNETATGYLQYECPQGTAITACYNDELLFVTSYPANSTTILVSGTAIFDQLGGFLGAPAALLLVLSIYSLGTGRNFPIIAVIAMAAMGIMGALGLMVLDGSVWALLIVITGISLFGVRKFF